MFNLVISRAAAAGEAGVAQGAYERMCDAGVVPTAETFTPLIDLLLQSERTGEEDVSRGVIMMVL